MRDGHRLASTAVACVVGLTLACSGKTSGGDGGAPAGGGASEGACDDYFRATYIEGNCAILPTSEVTRLESRFDTACVAVLALPGIGVNSSALDACASAVKSGGCNALDQSSGPCVFGPGTLAGGSACVSDSQCQSGDCSAQSEAADGGEILCGTCATSAAIGQACADGEPCGPGAVCTSGSAGGLTCAAITRVGAGASCTGTTTQCTTGLYCSLPSAQCASPGGAGAACEEDMACASPLVCRVANGSGTCQSPGGAGTPCEGDLDCASGLGCVDIPPASECATLTFAAGGQPCGPSVRCLVGECLLAGEDTTGTCPTVIPDGQPCSPTDLTTTCDTFALCAGGTCVAPFPTCP